LVLQRRPRSQADVPAVARLYRIRLRSWRWGGNRFPRNGNSREGPFALSQAPTGTSWDRIERMRSILATLLAVGFSSSLIMPALVADSESQLPVCCRRLGSHHCAMPGGGQPPPPGLEVKAVPREMFLVSWRHGREVLRRHVVASRWIGLLGAGFGPACESHSNGISFSDLT